MAAETTVSNRIPQGLGDCAWKCLQQQQDQRAQNWDDWVCVLGWLEQGFCGRDEGELGGSVDEKEEEFFLVFGSAAGRASLNARRNDQGWPVDKADGDGMEIRVRRVESMDRWILVLYSQVGGPSAKAPVG
ncbi:hypothetical protein ACHAQJ_009686 [Trichoderma viride]